MATEDKAQAHILPGRTSAPGEVGTAPLSSVRDPRGLSLFVKLAIVMLSLVVGSIALLAFYLSASQLEELRLALEGKAATYGRLVGKLVEPAIAFRDTQTAREVFDSVAEDADIDALTLYTEQGAPLHARGVASPELEARRRDVTEPRLVTLRDRVAALVPVTSLEGPKGLLVLEVSPRRLEEARRLVLQRAGTAALVTVLAGALGAYLIAKSLTRRLSAMAAVADKVAAGDLEQGPADQGGARDEIGRLAVAFNAMLGQIRALFAQIRESAQKEQERLEGLVAARTAELATRNVEMRRVLDNVGQGFFSLDLSGRMSRQRSAIVEQWFGPAPDDGSFARYLSGISPRAGQWFELGWESVTEGFLPLEVALDQLPKHLEWRGKSFEFDYRPIAGETEELRQVLVVVSDVTAQRERERAEAGEREMTQLFSRLVADRAGTLEFFSEGASLVQDVARVDIDQATLKRAIHTLKGNAGIFGLDSFARHCHVLEDGFQERGQLTRPELADLATRWQKIEDKVRPFVSDLGDQVEIHNKEYEELLSLVQDGGSRHQIQQALLSWRLEPTSTRLHRIAEQATALATRLHKGSLQVRIEDNDLRLEPAAWAEFWAAAVHVVRNAVDHGLQTEEERAEAGKAEPPTLLLRTCLTGDRFAIEFTDNGRGIDWKKVAERARDLGLPASGPSDLRAALLAEGLSTRDTATELSGRGVGLAVARAACQRLGGDVEIESELGKGTTFRFVFSAITMTAKAEKRLSLVPDVPASASRRFNRPHLQPSLDT